jgi:hypothetical protein
MDWGRTEQALRWSPPLHVGSFKPGVRAQYGKSGDLVTATATKRGPMRSRVSAVGGTRSSDRPIMDMHVRLDRVVANPSRWVRSRQP